MKMHSLYEAVDGVLDSVSQLFSGVARYVDTREQRLRAIDAYIDTYLRRAEADTPKNRQAMQDFMREPSDWAPKTSRRRAVTGSKLVFDIVKGEIEGELKRVTRKDLSDIPLPETPRVASCAQASAPSDYLPG